MFVAALLDPNSNRRFLSGFLPFQRRVARLGLWNSLSQTLLKLTCPGVPDIYQGNDLWDFSLVDPDNRRPVDYLRRQQAFESVRNFSDVNTAAVRDLLETPEDGRLKLYATWRTLCLRKQHPDLFRQGEYLPLPVHGLKAHHVIAFIRRFEATSALVVVPRLVAGLLGDAESPPIGSEIWKDAHVVLPSCGCLENYRNAFTGDVPNLWKTDTQTKLEISNALAEFPVALYFTEGSSVDGV